MRRARPEKRARCMYARGVEILSRGVSDEYTVICPYCGEEILIVIESDVRGSFIQDCEVCCNPWTVTIVGHGTERDIDVTRADGSE